MSKSKHRTPYRLLTFHNGSGYKFTLSKKVPTTVPSTAMQGYMAGQSVRPVQKTNGPRVTDLPNPGKDQTLWLKRTYRLSQLHWEYGFRIEDPNSKGIFHVYSSEQRCFIRWCAEDNSGNRYRNDLTPMGQINTQTPGYYKTLITRNWPHSIVRLYQISNVRLNN